MRRSDNEVMSLAYRTSDCRLYGDRAAGRVGGVGKKSAIFNVEEFVEGELTISIRPDCEEKIKLTRFDAWPVAALGSPAFERIREAF